MLNKEEESKQIEDCCCQKFPPSFCLSSIFTTEPWVLSRQKKHKEDTRKKESGKIPDSSASNFALAAASETTTAQSLTDVGIKKALMFWSAGLYLYGFLQLVAVTVRAKTGLVKAVTS